MVCWCCVGGWWVGGYVDYFGGLVVGEFAWSFDHLREKNIWNGFLDISCRYLCSLVGNEAIMINYSFFNKEGDVNLSVRTCCNHFRCNNSRPRYFSFYRVIIAYYLNYVHNARICFATILNPSLFRIYWCCETAVCFKAVFFFEGNTTEVAASACNHQGWCSELKMVSYTVRMKVHREI